MKFLPSWSKCFSCQINWMILICFPSCWTISLNESKTLTIYVFKTQGSPDIKSLFLPGQCFSRQIIFCDIIVLNNYTTYETNYYQVVEGINLSHGGPHWLLVRFETNRDKRVHWWQLLNFNTFLASLILTLLSAIRRSFIIFTFFIDIFIMNPKSFSRGSGLSFGCLNIVST